MGTVIRSMIIVYMHNCSVAFVYFTDMTLYNKAIQLMKQVPVP